MRKFTKMMLTLTLLVVGVGGVNSAKVYEIDYSALDSYPFYVMGFTPTFENGAMVDNPPGDWHQYFIADGISTTVEGTYAGVYIVKAMVKASESCSFNVNMGWGWEDGQRVGATVVIPQSDEFIEVEWSYSGVEGTSCNLVAQPGTATATIEWKSLAVYSYDDTKNHVLKVTNSSAKANFWDNTVTYTFAEPLTEGTKYTVTAKICAADVARGSVMRFVLNGGDSSKYGGDKAILANTFTQVSQVFTAGSNTGLEIDLGFVNGRVYIDDVSVVAEGSSTNLVSNGDFEVALSTAGWAVPSYTGQSIGHSEQAQGEVALGARKVTIGTTGWATMIAPDFAVSVPGGVDAYYAKYDSEKNNVKLTPIENMPQYGRAVINGEPGDYYFPQITSGVTADWADNGMEISWGDVKSDGTHYALGAIDGVVGFVKVKSGVKIPSGKPYLVIPGGSAREFIGFGEDETTGIENLTPALSEGEGTIYDLQGRRVAQPTKGLYIVNGKKVLVK